MRDNKKKGIALSSQLAFEKLPYLMSNEIHYDHYSALETKRKSAENPGNKKKSSSPPPWLGIPLPSYLY